MRPKLLLALCLCLLTDINAHAYGIRGLECEENKSAYSEGAAIPDMLPADGDLDEMRDMLWYWWRECYSLLWEIRTELEQNATEDEAPGLYARFEELRSYCDYIAASIERASSTEELEGCQVMLQDILTELFRFKEDVEELNSAIRATTIEGVVMTFSILSEEDKTMQVGTGRRGGNTCIDRFTSGTVTIPATVGDYTVTTIAEDAFKYCSYLTSVIIPESVTTIGFDAFDSCESLTSITIPESVTSICSGAFEDCCNLVSVTIPSGITCIEGQVFYRCNRLTSVIIPEGVTSIGNQAFWLCSDLASITIPSSVKHISYGAFYGCRSLTSITIPINVTNIEKYVFSYCNELTSITVEEGNDVYDSRNDCNGIIETATNTLIAGCQNTVMPNSVTCIGQGAFCGCNSIFSVTIPENVTSIGSEAFYNCNNLTSVSITEGVTSIGSHTFGYCTSLKEIHCLAEETPDVASNAFAEIDVSKIMLVVPDNAVEKYRAHPVWRQFMIETPTDIQTPDPSPRRAEIYNVAGHRLDKMPKGINIIRRSDGTTRKVMVK